MWGKLLTGVGWENFIKLLPLVSQKHTSGLGGSQGMHCGGQQCGKARSPALLIQNTRKKSRLWNWQSGAGCVPKNPLTLSDIISEFLSSFSLSFPDNTNKRLNYSPWDSFFHIILLHPAEDLCTFTFISLQHIFIRLGELLLLWVVWRQQTRYETGHGGSQAGLWRR